MFINKKHGQLLLKHFEPEKDFKIKTVMGIDQSFTNTGITVIRKDKKTGEEKILNSFGIKTNNKSTIEERILLIKNRILETIKEYKVELVYIEGLAYQKKSTNNGMLLAGLFFTIISSLLEKQIFYSIIAPKTLKKFAADNATAKKNEIIENIDPIVLITLENFSNTKHSNKLFEDIADSYFLAKMAIEENG